MSVSEMSTHEALEVFSKALLMRVSTTYRVGGLTVAPFMSFDFMSTSVERRLRLSFEGDDSRYLQRFANALEALTHGCNGLNHEIPNTDLATAQDRIAELTALVDLRTTQLDEKNAEFEKSQAKLAGANRDRDLDARRRYYEDTQKSRDEVTQKSQERLRWMLEHGMHFQPIPATTLDGALLWGVYKDNFGIAVSTGASRGQAADAAMRWVRRCAKSKRKAAVEAPDQ